MSLIKFDEMKKTWYEIAKYQHGDLPTSFELEVHKKLLNLFHVGEFYYYIVNLPRVEMEYISDSVCTVLGLQDRTQFSVEYIYEMIHPDDKPRFIAHEQKVTKFFNELPPEKVMKYKVSYDYRLKKPDGQYIWVLMQTVTIQSDETGAVLRVLGVQTNISHIKQENKPSGLSFLGLDGEPSYYDVDVAMPVLAPAKPLFTVREQEILQLMLDGKNSVEIATFFSISRHTVNTHRKKILAKSGCRSLVELGAKMARNPH